MSFRIAPIIAAIILSLATVTSSPPVRAQEPDVKCRAEQLEAKLSSGVIPDMVGCELKPTLVVLRRFDHIPTISKASGPPPAGTIVSQTPPAETQRRSDTPIALAYSDGNAAAPAYVPEPVPNLSVSVTTEPSAPYKPGDVIRFWIVVRNHGDGPIPFARVSMQLTNLTIVNVNPTFPDACHELPCDLREIPPDANVSVFVRARIGDERSFRTVITASPRPLDAATADNSVIVEGEFPEISDGGPNVPASADISVAISASPNEARPPGAPVTFIITIHNDGPQAATNVNFDLTAENFSVEEVTKDCSNLPCTIPGIAPNGDASLIVRATVGAAGLFRASVHASSGDDDDVDEDNNTASYVGAIFSDPPPIGQADLSVILTGAPAKPSQLGDAARFVFSVHNAGPDTATSVEVSTSTETAPVGITQACGTSPCRIAAGSSIAVELNTSLESVGPFMGRLKVSAAEGDPDPSNNSAVFAGQVVPKRTEIPWIWIIAAVLGLIGAGVATHALRKARWSRMIKVTPRVDPRGEITIGPIEPVIPIEVRIRIEQGETESSPIPIRDT